MASTVISQNIDKALDRAMDAGQGLLRMAPNWVPRSFLHPGRRLKLHPDDYYALGVDRGGIDERWFGSTTIATNDNRADDEGLSYVVSEGQKFLLTEAVSCAGARIVGKAMFDEYGKWPVYSKFFDNMGPIPHHMHHSHEHAAHTGQEGKPEAYYFPPQLNNVDNNFAYTFMGLEPGTTKDQIRKCLENWNKGDNGLLYLTRAYRLQRGSGWLIPAGVLHAPGSLLTYEPQWGSDVFAMFQNIVEDRAVPWHLLTKDVPEDKRQDLDYIIDMLDWEKNVDTHFAQSNQLMPIIDEGRSGEGYTDRWIVYGRLDDKQLFTAKELTIEPGAKMTLTDEGASCWITVQGEGRMGSLKLQTPAMIRFGEETEDEVFITHEAATNGVEIENTGSEPLVGLRYFGPDTHSNMPNIGDAK